MLPSHELPLRATSVGGFSLCSLHILKGLGRLLYIQAIGFPEHTATALVLGVVFRSSHRDFYFL